MIKSRIPHSYVLLILLFGITYSHIWKWLYERWTWSESFYSHGFLIPFVSLWLCFRSKNALVQANQSPDYRGLFVLLPAIGAHMCAVRLDLYSPSGLTLPLVISGLVIYLKGFDVFKILCFPIAYLYFAIPLPLNWIQETSYELKSLAIGLSTGLAGVFGAQIQEKGAYLVFQDGGTLLVGSPCSGLRSLIALFALGILFVAAFSSLNKKGAGLFILLMGPIAVFSNVLRITFLCLIADSLGAQATKGWVHDLSGYLIYVIALVLMLGLNRGLSSMNCFAGEKS